MPCVFPAWGGALAGTSKGGAIEGMRSGSKTQIFLKSLETFRIGPGGMYSSPQFPSNHPNLWSDSRTVL